MECSAGEINPGINLSFTHHSSLLVPISYQDICGVLLFYSPTRKIPFSISIFIHPCSRSSRKAIRTAMISFCFVSMKIVVMDAQLPGNATAGQQNQFSALSTQFSLPCGQHGGQTRNWGDNDSFRLTHRKKNALRRSRQWKRKISSYPRPW